MAFADSFPESLQEIPCRLKPFQFNPDEPIDGVVLAYQVWYLSPSIPVSSFLQSPEAARVIRNRPVVTIIGCRNMWLTAQEKVKARIVGHQGIPAGNIVLVDRAPNLPGVVSIAAWMMTGRKDRFLKIFPKAGIDEEDIQGADRFGRPLLEALKTGDFKDLQENLNRLGAVTVVPSYILFEQRMSKIFAFWSKFIRQKGGPGDPARRLRVRLFIAYLLTAIFLIAPLATVITYALQKINKEKLNRQVTYFAGNHYNPLGSG
jgi:hypothetical protein